MSPLQADPKWLASFVVHHAYVRPGEKLPTTWGDGFLHVSERNDDTGLDVWWYGPPDPV